MLQGLKMMGINKTVAGGATGEQRDGSGRGGRGTRGRGRGRGRLQQPSNMEYLRQYQHQLEQQRNDLGFTATKIILPEFDQVGGGSIVVGDDDDDGSEVGQGEPYDAFDTRISELLARRPDLVIEPVEESDDPQLPTCQEGLQNIGTIVDEVMWMKGRGGNQDQGNKGHQSGVDSAQMGPGTAGRKRPLTYKMSATQRKWQPASEMVFSRNYQKAPEGTFTFNSSVGNCGGGLKKRLPRLLPKPTTLPQAYWIQLATGQLPGSGMGTIPSISFNPREQGYLVNKVINAITTAEGQSPATSPPVSKLLKYKRKEGVKKDNSGK